MEMDTLAVASNIGDVTDTIENIENSNSLREKLRLGQKITRGKN